MPGRVANHPSPHTQRCGMFELAEMCAHPKENTLPPPPQRTPTMQAIAKEFGLLGQRLMHDVVR